MAKVLTFTACAAAVGVALYAAAGYVGVPYAVRTVIEKNVSELLNRTVTLDDVRFNPWTWVFELRGLTIPEEGSDPLLSLGLLRIDASSQTLFKLAPVLDEITIDGLKVNAVVNEKNRRELEKLLGGNDADKATQTAAKSADSSDAGLPQFALYNITVANSSLRYQDKSQGIDESLTDLSVKLPFVSTMESARESLVTPALSLKLNGSAIEATGTTKPFGKSLEAQLNLKVQRLDAARLARILPQLRTRELTVAGADLSSDINFIFRNPTGGQPAKMLLSGTTSLDNVSITQDGKAIITLPKASVTLKEVDLTAQKAVVQNIVATGLTINASQSKTGINLLRAVDSAAGAASSQANTAAAAPKDAGGNAGSSVWNWTVASASLRDGALNWHDSTVSPAAAVSVKNIDASVKNLSSAAGEKSSFNLSLETLGGKLSAAGTATIAPLSVEATAKGSNLSPAAAAPYLKAFLKPSLTLTAGFDLTGAYDGKDAKASGTVNVANFALKEGKTTLASVKSAAVKLSEFSTASRTAKVESIAVVQPTVYAVMTKSGLNLSQLTVETKPSTAKKTSKEETAKTNAVEPAWNWSLGQATVTNGSLKYRDESISPAASVEIPKINAALKNVSSKSGTKSSVDFSADLGGGSLTAAGNFVLAPLSADIGVKGANIGLKSFSNLMQGYAGLGAKSGTLEADGRATVRTQKEQNVFGWKGNASLASLDLTNAKGTSLMSWTKAALTGMDVETTDPIKLIIAKAEIDQPAEKQTKVLKEAAGVASLISSLMGKDKTAQKIQKYSDKVPTKISLQNIRYENGKLSAAGISSASIEGLILQKLSDAMGEKLGSSTTSAK